ncbi:hypothetical protein H5P28_07225 [Ruficoccus amylovorans]|uniref:Uncharacterized protein n=1 Tax=Ruficoccus amylovorans TaxID=1804625 RepID=A0A842HFH9_9BACT|nr:hypothetical protein [Ruficoccus amylovorans]MBC2594051.1 hypothetical protein [Ruficoccus amylovorans]
MSDEEKKDTPPPAQEAAHTPPPADNDKPAAPAEKPQFKVTRSPFTAKAPGAEGAVKLPTPPKPVTGAPKPPSPVAGAPKPPSPSPVAANTAAKPAAPVSRPKPSKPVPKARAADPVVAEGSSVSALGLAVDAVCAVVAVVFAALIFVSMKG